MVLVLDKHKKALMPCTEKRARLLLDRGQATVDKLYPFTIRLKDRLAENSEYQVLKVKLDPGSKQTGIALVREMDHGDKKKTIPLLLIELQHRGSQISEKLTKRSAMRRRRRSQNLRYRKPRFLNRTKPKGWLAPSLQHRIHTTVSWVKKLMSLAPVMGVSQELVRFDMQLMGNPDIGGVEYQQGELQGYEVREYLLNKWKRKCTYCDANNIPLQIEHIHPRSKGGSDRISNLCLACDTCNKAKSNHPIEVFLSKKPQVLQKILKQAKLPLKDAAAVNNTRWALANELTSLNSNVELASGGKTKFNRCQQGIPKSHALDAVCVGEVGEVEKWNIPMLIVKCTGRGSYQRTRLNAYGFPRGYLTRQKSIKGFQTGDMVIANVTKGKKQGIHKGRVAVRASGSFNIKTTEGLVQGISHKYCTVIARGDGYGYLHQPKIALEKEESEKRAA